MQTSWRAAGQDDDIGRNGCCFWFTGMCTSGDLATVVLAADAVLDVEGIPERLALHLWILSQRKTTIRQPRTLETKAGNNSTFAYLYATDSPEMKPLQTRDTYLSPNLGSD